MVLVLDRLQMALDIRCDPDYYGPRCDCHPEDDDVKGHYRCDVNGVKICHAGKIQSRHIISSTASLQPATASSFDLTAVGLILAVEKVSVEVDFCNGLLSILIMFTNTKHQNFSIFSVVHDDNLIIMFFSHRLPHVPTLKQHWVNISFFNEQSDYHQILNFICCEFNIPQFT